MADTPKRKKNKKIIGQLVVYTVIFIIALILVFMGIRLLSGEQSSFPGATQPTLNISVNNRLEKDFAEDNGRITYPGALAGIDVSSHQGEIDWQRVKADGIDFAVLRLGYRGYGTGALCLDDTFAANLSGAQSAGIDIGIYFFSQANSEAEAVEEAEFIIDALDGCTLQYPVFFDWEEVSEAERTKDVSQTAISDFALAFCRRIEEAGYRGGVYFSQSYAMARFRLHELRDYAFWLAEYDPYMSFFYDVDMWQYTGSGSVAGIATDVDMNLFYTD